MNGIKIISIILIILILAIIIFILLYRKPQKTNFNINSGGSCYMDSDCNLQFDNQENAYNSICAIEGKATSGTCSPFCINDGDCWYGRSIGSSQCITEESKSVCRLKSCTSDGDCASSDEACTSIPNRTGQYCLKVGYTPGTNTPLPCQSNNNCFGSSLVCLAPYPTVSVPCCTSANCPTGFTCSGNSQLCTDITNCGNNCGTCQAGNFVQGYCSQYASPSDCPSGNGAYGRCQ